MWTLHDIELVYYALSLSFLLTICLIDIRNWNTRSINWHPTWGALALYCVPFSILKTNSYTLILNFIIFKFQHCLEQVCWRGYTLCFKLFYLQCLLLIFCIGLDYISYYNKSSEERWTETWTSCSRNHNIWHSNRQWLTFLCEAFN